MGSKSVCHACAFWGEFSTARFQRFLSYWDSSDSLIYLTGSPYCRIHCDNTLGACHLIFSTAFSKQSNLFCTFPSRSKASQDPISAYTFLEISSNQPGHSMLDKAPSHPCYDITSTIDINLTKPPSAFSVDNHTARCGYRPWRIRMGSVERPGEENLLGGPWLMS